MPGLIVNPGSVTGEWKDPIVDGRTTLARQVDEHERRLAALEAPDVSAEGPRLTVVRTQLEQALLLLEENPDEPMPDPWRNNVINRVERALEYLPPAGEDDTIATLQQRLAVEYDGRVAAEATLAAIRKLVPDWYDPVTMCGSDIIAADDLLDILDGDA